jgi:hypothetical protein
MPYHELAVILLSSGEDLGDDESLSTLSVPPSLVERVDEYGGDDIRQKYH